MFKKITEGNVAFTAEKNKVCGGPRIVLLSDETFLLVLWYQQMGGTGIRYVHLRKEV